MGHPENRRQESGVRKRSIARPVECGGSPPLFAVPACRNVLPALRDDLRRAGASSGHTAARCQASLPGTIYRAPTKRFASRPPVAPASCRRISGAPSKTKIAAETAALQEHRAEWAAARQGCVPLR